MTNAGFARLKLTITFGMIAFALAAQLALTGTARAADEAQVLPGVFMEQAAGDFERMQPIQVSYEGRSDYFIITGSFRSKSSAYRHARNRGGHVINTSRFPNLRSGYYSVVYGPFTIYRAKQFKRRNGLRGYIKSGW